jgi:hypothetical protein
MAGAIYYDETNRVWSGEVRIQDGTANIGPCRTQGEVELEYVQAEYVLNHVKPSEVTIPKFVTINLKPVAAEVKLVLGNGTEFRVGDLVVDSRSRGGGPIRIESILIENKNVHAVCRSPDGDRSSGKWLKNNEDFLYLQRVKDVKAAS